MKIIKTIVALKVFPSSGRLQILLDKNGLIKLYIKSPAEKGKANKEILAFLAKQLGVQADQVELLSGDTSQKKRISIASSMTLEQIYQRLGLSHQIAMGE